MEYTPIGNISDAYIVLLPCLLAPVLWERPANISPLVRLLSAFTVHAAPQIVAQDKVVSAIGITNAWVITVTCYREVFWVFFKN
jgi:exportin-2 (importin alpha re-exporter)